MSSRRRNNKKAWARQRKKASRSRGFESDGPRPAPAQRRTTAASVDLLSRVKPQPSELDQISVLIVEEQLNLPVTDLDGMKKIVAKLPFEPCMSLLAILAGRVEATLSDGRRQIDLAREFFGGGPLMQRYAQIIASDDRSRIFGPQSLYTLMRVLIDEAYDAPITQQLTDEERGQFFRAVVASNSVIERGIDMSVGPTTEDLLAYELQAGAYYARPQWMEEMSRHWDLYELMATDPDLAKKVFQNDGSRRQQRIEQASVRKARWISGSRS